MYLRVGSRLRPFNEATVAVSYQPRYDVKHRMTEIEETWSIAGRVVQSTNATQQGMTIKLRQLEQDFMQYRPDLVFLEDNGVTESFYKLLRSECIEGPRLIQADFPGNGADVYPTGQGYGATFVGVKSMAGSGGDVLSEFVETVTEEEGGPVYGYVGGAINFAELQQFKQSAPYIYTQEGSAVGLYNWPPIPPPLWPNNMLQKVRPSYVSPREIGPVPRYYEVRWRYVFGSVYPLSGLPHVIV